MTRLRRRPTPPPSATPAARTPRRDGRSSGAGQKRRPNTAVTPRTGPGDRLRPNLFISPVIGRTRARAAQKATPLRPVAKSRSAAGKTPDKPPAVKKTSDKSVKAEKHRTDAAKASARKTAPANSKELSDTSVSSKRGSESAKPAAGSGSKKSGQTRAKKERTNEAVQSVPRATSATAAKTPTSTLAKGKEADSAKVTRHATKASEVKAPLRVRAWKESGNVKTDVPVENISHRPETSKSRASGATAKSVSFSAAKTQSCTPTEDKENNAGKAAKHVAKVSEVKTAVRVRSKKQQEASTAQSNVRPVGTLVDQTPRRPKVSKARTTDTAAKSAPVSKGNTLSQIGAKASLTRTAAAKPQPTHASQTPRRNKSAAEEQKDNRSKTRARQPPAVADSRAEATSTHGGNRPKTDSSAAGGHKGTVAEPVSIQASAALSDSVGKRDASAPPPVGILKTSQPSSKAVAGVSPLKRPRAGVLSTHPAPGPTGSGGATADTQTPSKRQRLDTTPPTAAASLWDEVTSSPSRFTAILPRPRPRSPAAPVPTPLPPSEVVTEPLTAVPKPLTAPKPPSEAVMESLAVATPRRRRLPRHVTSTPCGPPAPPPPPADTAEACYGFLEDVEAEDAEDSAPLEQLVSPVGVSRPRPPPPQRLKDATNLPSRFNAGRLARKPTGERPEVTTTVASQLMDPEVTFSKPASRSYSRRRHPSTISGGHSTLGHSTLGSEAGDVTRVKQRRHHRRERDEQLEAEMERWAALVNSKMSEVDSFELVVERS